jgi:phage/plasmid replication protein, gene II/X family
MLDWYSGLIGYDASNMKLGMIYEVSPHGELLYKVEPWIKAKGSYESSVQVKRDMSTKEMREIADEAIQFDLYGTEKPCPPVVLKMSGNPVKFLQGHNVFGPGANQINEILQAFVRALPDELKPVDSGIEGLPVSYSSRFDINVMIDMGSHAMVHDWLRYAGSSTRSRHGRPLVSGDTVYWGPHSRRWSMKAYCKFCEMAAAGHRPADPSMYEYAREFVEQQLRLELTLRRPEIKKLEKDEVYQCLGLDERLVWDFLERISVGVMKANVVEIRPNLKHGVENVLTLWLSGYPVQHHLPKATFYRYRRIILDEVGVDISLDPEPGRVIERAKFDLSYLKDHEVKSVPKHLQRWLFKPGVK